MDPGFYRSIKSYGLSLLQAREENNTDLWARPESDIHTLQYPHSTGQELHIGPQLATRKQIMATKVEVIHWEIGTDIYTLLFIKQVTNKGLL